jgi:acetylglutamate/LysW-gamma-L-alpha-aminoadipate kinase
MLLIKVGGGKDINWDGICGDILSLMSKEQVICVHGASVQRDEIAAKMSVPVKTVVSPSGISSVYTDPKSLEVFLMAYAGLLNKQVVSRMLKHGINEVGLSGIDGKLWVSKSKKQILIRNGKKVKLLKYNITGRV